MKASDTLIAEPARVDLPVELPASAPVSSPRLLPPANKAALELTAEEARRLCQYSTDIVCISDFSGNILWSNKVECAITGFSPEELENMSLEERTHPDDLEKVYEGLKDIASAVLHPCTEVRTLCKDGSYKWISWSGMPLLEEKKIYSIGRDVTAQKRAEEMARHLAAIVEASTEAIFGIDCQSRILSWNRGAQMLYGWTPEEILGQPVLRLFHPSRTVDTGNSEIAGFLSRSEDLHQSKAGAKITVSISSFPVADESGSQSWAAIVRDVTLQKEAERSIAEFYSITSHELRTPLCSVRGVLSLLENGLVDPASEEGRELLGIARSSSDRLIRLVNDILDLRRIESGSMPLKIEPLAIEELIECALANIKGIALEAEVNIESDLSIKSAGLDPAKIYGDRDRLTQVLTNFLSNGVKYSRPGKAVLVRVEKLQTDYLRFSVIDEGPGIPVEQVPRLFKKFGQLDSSDARPKEGIGLGLFVARSIIELHKGRIGVMPAETGGSQFWFELKLGSS